MVGRGAVNQKGPETAFLTALRAFKASGVKLPVNLVFVAEGEEEIASPNFSQVVTQPEVRAALEKAVGIFIPSASQSVDGQVTLSAWAPRARSNCSSSPAAKNGVAGPNKDIHSSLKANVDSPVWHLIKALNTLVSEDGQTPAIDGWYENVKPLTARQKELIAADVAAGNEADDMKVLGIKHWYKDEDYLTASYRLAEQPTINIQGLVSGYMGPGGKTVLPGRAEAKIDLRLVPDMTKDEVVSKLKAHLAKRGFGDIEVNVSGGYGPTQTDENSPLIKAEQATLADAKIPATLSARSAGSWPGVVFTGPPLHLPAGQFGGGRGGGAHAPDEWLLIDSSNPKVLGFDGQAILYADFLYEVARTAKVEALVVGGSATGEQGSPRAAGLDYMPCRARAPRGRHVPRPCVGRLMPASRATRSIETAWKPCRATIALVTSSSCSRRASADMRAGARVAIVTPMLQNRKLRLCKPP